MVSKKLFQFLDGVVAARLDVVVQRGDVSLGWSGHRTVRAETLERLKALLTDDIKDQIIKTFGEGDFEWHELASFITYS